MSMAKKCDICGVLYEGYSNKFCNGISLEKIHVNSPEVAMTMQTLDCCEECMDSILELIKWNKGEKNES